MTLQCVSSLMINTFQIQRLKLPPMFIFDSLRLYAQFLSCSVDLATLKYQSAQFSRSRTLNLDVQLKLPQSRYQFLLVLQVLIINMQIPLVEISVDLHQMEQWNRYEFVFESQVGTVEVEVNLIEEIYLPKQDYQSWQKDHSQLGNSRFRRGFSSSKKINQKRPDKMGLSRSQYLKLQMEESLLQSQRGNTETQSQIKAKSKALK